MRRLIMTLGVLAGLLVGLANAPTGQVLAHANLIRSQPEENALLDQAPAEVRLFFSEPLEPRFSEIIVYDRNRTPVAQANSQVDPADPTVMFLPLPNLGEGTYTVAWKALSTVDGHITQGAFAFGVGVRELAADPAIAGGVATERPSAPVVVAKWLSLLGLAGLVGGLIFAVAIVGPIARSQSAAAGATIAEGWLRRWVPTIWISGAVLVAGLIGGALARGALITEGGLGGAIGWLLSPLAWSTRQGGLTIAGLVLALLLIAVAAWAARRTGSGRWMMDDGPSTKDLRLSSAGHGPPSTVHGPRSIVHRPSSIVRLGGPAWWPALGVAAGLLVVFSLGSHQAVPSDFTGLAVAADWLHLLAACAWLGGLFHLLVTWRPAVAELKTERERAAALAALMPRFSVIGLFSVALLVGTGFFIGWLQIGTPAGLTETFYGRTLLIKLALFLPMLALGAANLLWVSPRVTAIEAAGRRLERALTYGQRFRRFVALEVGFGILVLLTVGVLTNASPAFQAALAPKPIVAETRADGLRLTLTVTPGQVGQNIFDLAIADANGRPVTDAERVRLQFEMTQMSMGQLVEEAEPRGDGHYVARGSQLSMGGPWQVDVLFRRPGEADTQATFNLDVRALPVNPVLAPPGPGAWPVGWAIGPALLVIGLLLAFNARRLVPAGRRLATGTALVGFLSFIGGAYFFATAVQAGTTGLPQNPIPASEASLARGQALYQQSCAVCHGAEGRGNGPAAAGLNPRPVDLTVHATQHPPGQLFVWISQGIRGTAMPAFESTYSEEDRWHLVNYIRSLAEPRQ